MGQSFCASFLSNVEPEAESFFAITEATSGMGTVVIMDCISDKLHSYLGHDYSMTSSLGCGRGAAEVWSGPNGPLSAAGEDLSSGTEAHQHHLMNMLGWRLTICEVDRTTKVQQRAIAMLKRRIRY